MLDDQTYMQLTLRVGVDALSGRGDVVLGGLAIGLDRFVALGSGRFRVGRVRSGAAAATHRAGVDAGFAVGLGRSFGLFDSPEERNVIIVSFPL